MVYFGGDGRKRYYLIYTIHFTYVPTNSSLGDASINPTRAAAPNEQRDGRTTLAPFRTAVCFVTGGTGPRLRANPRHINQLLLLNLDYFHYSTTQLTLDCIIYKMNFKNTLLHSSSFILL